MLLILMSLACKQLYYDGNLVIIFKKTLLYEKF